MKIEPKSGAYITAGIIAAASLLPAAAPYRRYMLAAAAVLAGFAFFFIRKKSPPLTVTAKSYTAGISPPRQPDSGQSAPASNFDPAPYAKRLHSAFFGNFAGWGTDEKTIFEIFDTLNAQQLADVFNSYNTIYARDLLQDLTDELTADEFEKIESKIKQLSFS